MAFKEFSPLITLYNNSHTFPFVRLVITGRLANYTLAFNRVICSQITTTKAIELVQRPNCLQEKRAEQTSWKAWRMAARCSRAFTET